MEQPCGPPTSPPPPGHVGRAVEDHGRAVTASPQAAAWYRQAQRAIDCHRAVAALRLAVTADPAFGLAVADLGALTTLSGGRPRRGQMNWERHHIEVVGATATGDTDRAADLLGEHSANVGCDPLATRIVAHLRQSTPTTTDRPPNCHPSEWECCS